MTSLSGIWAASLTPLTSDLAIDHARLSAHVRWLLDRGCHGVVLLGTTGEGNSFSVSERIELMERAAEGGLPVERLMVGTGATAPPDAVELTRRAVQLGFRSVLLLPPFYYKSVSDDGVYAYVQRVIDQVADEALKIVLYHIPAVAGVGYSIELISRLRTFYPENVEGVKDSSGDEAYLDSLCREFPGFGTFAGSERFLQQCLAGGGVGCVTATGNLTSHLVRSVYDNLLLAGVDGSSDKPADDADSAAARTLNPTGLTDKLQLMLAFRTGLEAGPLVPILKHLMSARSGDPAWRTLRPPFVELDSLSIETLENRLAGLPTLPNFVL